MEQVGKLLRGKFVAFEVGDEFAIPGDNHDMQRMNKESFVRNEVHSELVTYALDIGGGAGEEAPIFRVGFPGFCIVTQDLGLIADRVEGDGEQDQVFSHAVLKSLPERNPPLR